MVRRTIMTAVVFGLAAAGARAQTPVQADAADLPPNAKAGECYARVWIEPQYNTITERVLVAPATENVRIVQARFGTATERVLVQEAATRLEVVPATYEWAEERVLVKPATKRLVEVPAEYDEVTERVLVKEAYTTWKKGRGPIQKIDESTGEIMCLVEVPAEYKTVTTRKLKTPATTREIEIPAEYETVRKRVVKTPATTREVAVPARYDNVTVTKELEPAREVREAVPARYENVTKTLKISDGRLEWRSILCETNMTSTRIQDIQRALRSAGFDPGAIDGVIGESTMRAVNAYQRAKGLPVDRYLNMETVRSLGVM